MKKEIAKETRRRTKKRKLPSHAKKMKEPHEFGVFN